MALFICLITPLYRGAFIIIFIITSLHLYCRMIDDYKRRVDVVGVFIYNYTWSILFIVLYIINTV